MSYDITIGDKSFNYTSNVGRLFYDHIPDTGKGGGLRELVGATGHEAVNILAPAFEAMNETRHRLYVDGAIGEPAFSAEYDAKNGWGSLIGAIIFLAQVMGACAQNRKKIVHVSM